MSAIGLTLVGGIEEDPFIVDLLIFAVFITPSSSPNATSSGVTSYSVIGEGS